MDSTRRLIEGLGLFSVSDKTGLAALAKDLRVHGVDAISTGGTYKELAAVSIPVRQVSELTGFPEIMDGRVKTLHPKVHGGLLAIRDNMAHEQAMAEHGINPINLLVVNLYPFEATVAKGARFDECVENIDIGGPAMIRAAAKNHNDVLVVVDPGDYASLAKELDEHDGATTGLWRKTMAAKAFAHTAYYDSVIANWFAGILGIIAPKWRTFGGRLLQLLRYGENPHQQAAFYKTADRRFGVATAKQLQGKELSYNNINDTDAAFECVAEFDPKRTAACVIVKHANPCGVAEGETLFEAYRKALACDPLSAFGGVVAFNCALDACTANEVTKIFTEVIIAPEATEEAIAVVKRRKDLRLLITGGVPDPRAPGLIFKSVAGGMLVSTRDNAVVDDMTLKVVTKRVPTEQEMSDLRFAFRTVKYVKSNSIVYVKNLATVGIGAGQMSRVDSSFIGSRKADEAAREAKEPPLSRTEGSVIASDAFFPFADGLIAAIEAGATAVIQPGGSKNDQTVIDAADERGIAMVFTGVRHFRH